MSLGCPVINRLGISRVRLTRGTCRRKKKRKEEPPRRAKKVVGAEQNVVVRHAATETRSKPLQNAATKVYYHNTARRNVPKRNAVNDRVRLLFARGRSFTRRFRFTDLFFKWCFMSLYDDVMRWPTI